MYVIVPTMDWFVGRKVLIIFIFNTVRANQQNWCDLKVKAVGLFWGLICFLISGQQGLKQSPVYPWWDTKKDQIQGRAPSLANPQKFASCALPYNFWNWWQDILNQHNQPPWSSCQFGCAQKSSIYKLSSTIFDPLTTHSSPTQTHQSHPKPTKPDNFSTLTSWIFPLKSLVGGKALVKCRKKTRHLLLPCITHTKPPLTPSLPHLSKHSSKHPCFCLGMIVASCRFNCLLVWVKPKNGDLLLCCQALSNVFSDIGRKGALFFVQNSNILDFTGFNPLSNALWEVREAPPPPFHYSSKSCRDWTCKIRKRIKISTAESQKWKNLRRTPAQLLGWTHLAFDKIREKSGTEIRNKDWIK